MRTSLVSAGLMVALLTLPKLAQAQANESEAAQGFGASDPTVVSLEHLAGAVITRTKIEGSDDALTFTNLGAFQGIFGTLGPIPRLGLHRFVTPQLSLGALLSYYDADALGKSMLAGARVGYSLPLSDSTALWLRLGGQYVQTEQAFGLFKVKGFRPGAEALFVVHPARHFAFIVGGMFEMGVGNTIEFDSEFSSQASSSADYDYLEAGLTAGVLLDF